MMHTLFFLNSNFVPNTRYEYIHCMTFFLVKELFKRYEVLIERC